MNRGIWTAFGVMLLFGQTLFAADPVVVPEKAVAQAGGNFYNFSASATFTVGANDVVKYANFTLRWVDGNGKEVAGLSTSAKSTSASPTTAGGTVQESMRAWKPQMSVAVYGQLGGRGPVVKLTTDSAWVDVPK
jgi:hypothetical protein